MPCALNARLILTGECAGTQIKYMVFRQSLHSSPFNFITHSRKHLMNFIGHLRICRISQRRYAEMREAHQLPHTPKSSGHGPRDAARQAENAMERKFEFWTSGNRPHGERRGGYHWIRAKSTLQCISTRARSADASARNTESPSTIPHAQFIWPRARQAENAMEQTFDLWTSGNRPHGERQAGYHRIRAKQVDDPPCAGMRLNASRSAASTAERKFDIWPSGDHTLNDA